MPRNLIALALLLPGLLAVASPASAQPWGPCTQAHVDAGLCRSTNHDYVILDFPTAARPDVVAWARATSGWQPQILCDATRRVTDGVLTVAGVDAGDCSLAQVGELVPNPQPAGQVVYARMRFLVVNEVRTWLDARKRAAATVPVDPEPRPDIGSEEAPP